MVKTYTAVVLGLAVIIRILCWRSGYEFPGFVVAIYWIVAGVGLVPAAIIGSICAAADHRNERLRQMERSIGRIERRLQKVRSIEVDARTLVNDNRKIIVVGTRLMGGEGMQQRMLPGRGGVSEGRRAQ